MRHALLAFSLLAAACGGAARTNEEVAAPTASTPASASASPPPSAAPSASAVASTTPTTASPPSSTAFCRPIGRIHFEGGGGTSMDDAVRIVGAKGEDDGVASEYRCLDQALGSRKAGAWKLLNQALAGKNGRNFDVMSVELADGTKKQIFFDISDYFGKF